MRVFRLYWMNLPKYAEYCPRTQRSTFNVQPPLKFLTGYCARPLRVVPELDEDVHHT